MLAADSLVLTKQGQVPLDQVGPSPILWSGDRWEPYSVEPVAEPTPLVSFRTRSGAVIRLTADHHVLTARPQRYEWARLRDVTWRLPRIALQLFDISAALDTRDLESAAYWHGFLLQSRMLAVGRLWHHVKVGASVEGNMQHIELLRRMARREGVSVSLRRRGRHTFVCLLGTDLDRLVRSWGYRDRADWQRIDLSASLLPTATPSNDRARFLRGMADGARAFTWDCATIVDIPFRDDRTAAVIQRIGRTLGLRSVIKTRSKKGEAKPRQVARFDRWEFGFCTDFDVPYPVPKLLARGVDAPRDTVAETLALAREQKASGGPSRMFLQHVLDGGRISPFMLRRWRTAANVTPRCTEPAYCFDSIEMIDMTSIFARACRVVALDNARQIAVDGCVVGDDLR